MYYFCNVARCVTFVIICKFLLCLVILLSILLQRHPNKWQRMTARILRRLASCRQVPLVVSTLFIWRHVTFPYIYLPRFFAGVSLWMGDRRSGRNQSWVLFFWEPYGVGCTGAFLYFRSSTFAIRLVRVRVAASTVQFLVALPSCDFASLYIGGFNCRTRLGPATFGLLIRMLLWRFIQWFCCARVTNSVMDQWPCPRGIVA